MYTSDFIKEDESGIILKIRIIPSASKAQIIAADGMIKIKVTEPPVENKANKALVQYLSKYFRVPKTSVTIIRGETSKEKTIYLSVSDKNKKSEIMDELLKMCENEV